MKECSNLCSCPAGFLYAYEIARLRTNAIGRQEQVGPKAIVGQESRGKEGATHLIGRVLNEQGAAQFAQTEVT